MMQHYKDESEKAVRLLVAMGARWEASQFRLEGTIDELHLAHRRIEALLIQQRHYEDAVTHYQAALNRAHQLAQSVLDRAAPVYFLNRDRINSMTENSIEGDHASQLAEIIDLTTDEEIEEEEVIDLTENV